MKVVTVNRQFMKQQNLVSHGTRALKGSSFEMGETLALIVRSAVLCFQNGGGFECYEGDESSSVRVD